jgi:SpoVK/Ycf46/Vps4 family AAA+-type ATPase
VTQILTSLVERIEPTARLADTALPEHVWRQLKEARSGVVLFNGPRGAGKTMAAHAIARELGAPVLRIDLSRVVSKYSGETEKHLDAVFADAEQSGAVLLFDDADALFAKRSEAEDSHDRYSNVEVSYLLQRIEDFDGIAILTTNVRSNIDEAFLRRLRFVVEFPPRN